PAEAHAPVAPTASSPGAPPPVVEAPAEAHPAPAPREPHVRRHAVASHALVVSGAPIGGAAGDVAPIRPGPPAPPAAAEPTPAPAARGMREVLAEAEKLLGQGEVGDACARGEVANRLAPKTPQVHKFLGKCYMRAGRAREANDNYKKYLELAPSASDAPFVKSMIK
ncbi:MAG: hypothetical protein ACJ8F1_24890, partial [Polyangia bacterium]